MERLKLLLYFISGLFVILGALFKCLNEYSTEEEKSHTKLKFQEMWYVIQNSGFLLLSEKLIKGLIYFFNYVSNEFITFVNSISEKSVIIQFVILTTMAVSYNFLFVPYSAIYLIIFIAICIIIFFLVIIIKIIRFKVKRDDLNKWLQAYNYQEKSQLILRSLLSAYGLVVLFLIFSNLPIQFLCSSSLTFTPVITFYIIWLFKPLKLINTKNTYVEQNLILIGLAFGTTYFITPISLIIGNYLEPTDVMPNDIRLFLSNISFDSFTLLGTYHILKGSIQKKQMFSVPVAILLAVLLAALCACLTLYNGLFFTNQRIRMIQTVDVLIGHSVDGDKWDFGPYFWVMHTTFIPTCLYLLLILLTWIGKYISTPILHLLKRGKEHDKPFELTAVTFTFLGLALGGLAKMLDYFFHI